MPAAAKQAIAAISLMVEVRDMRVAEAHLLFERITCQPNCYAEHYNTERMVRVSLLVRVGCAKGKLQSTRRCATVSHTVG